MSASSCVSSRTASSRVWSTVINDVSSSIRTASQTAAKRQRSGVNRAGGAHGGEEGLHRPAPRSRLVQVQIVLRPGKLDHRRVRSRRAHSRDHVRVRHSSSPHSHAAASHRPTATRLPRQTGCGNVRSLVASELYGPATECLSHCLRGELTFTPEVEDRQQHASRYSSRRLRAKAHESPGRRPECVAKGRAFLWAIPASTLSVPEFSPQNRRGARVSTARGCRPVQRDQLRRGPGEPARGLE